MATIQSPVDSALFQAEACGLMKMGAELGGLSLFTHMIKIETFTLVLGMMTSKNTVSLPESTFYSTLKIQGYSLKGWLKLTRRESLLTLK